MTIGELARRTGLSPDTIRYYERIGLLPRPPRDAARRRDYDPEILVWIGFLARLKATGMPLKTMRIYAQLREQGPHTAAGRSDLLKTHRTAVATNIAEQRRCLAALDDKIATYEAQIAAAQAAQTSKPERSTPDASIHTAPSPHPLRTRSRRAQRD